MRQLVPQSPPPARPVVVVVVGVPVPTVVVIVVALAVVTVSVNPPVLVMLALLGMRVVAVRGSGCHGMLVTVPVVLHTAYPVTRLRLQPPPTYRL